MWGRSRPWDLLGRLHARPLVATLVVALFLLAPALVLVTPAQPVEASPIEAPADCPTDFTAVTRYLDGDAVLADVGGCRLVACSILWDFGEPGPEFAGPGEATYLEGLIGFPVSGGDITAPLRFSTRYAELCDGPIPDDADDVLADIRLRLGVPDFAGCSFSSRFDRGNGDLVAVEQLAVGEVWDLVLITDCSALAGNTFPCWSFDKMFALDPINDGNLLPGQVARPASALANRCVETSCTVSQWTTFGRIGDTFDDAPRADRVDAIEGACSIVQGEDCTTDLVFLLDGEPYLDNFNVDPMNLDPSTPVQVLAGCQAVSEPMSPSVTPPVDGAGGGGGLAAGGLTVGAPLIIAGSLFAAGAGLQLAARRARMPSSS